MDLAADWSELPTDLLELLVRRLDCFSDDHYRFGAVCRSWRSIAIMNRCHLPLNQFPGIMVPGFSEESETRGFLRLNHRSCFFEGVANSKQLKVPHEYVCRGSAYGWLFLTDDNLDSKLLNPFSGAEIQLPSVTTLPPAIKGWTPMDKFYVCKAIFSSNPSFQPLPLVFIIYGGSAPRLAFCKPGDKAWTTLQSPGKKNFYMDAIYYKDQFYALSFPGHIVAFDIRRRIDDDDHSVKATQMAPAPTGLIYMEDLYLVELDGELVKLKRQIMCDGDSDLNDASSDSDGNEYADTAHADFASNDDDENADDDDVADDNVNGSDSNDDDADIASKDDDDNEDGDGDGDDDDDNEDDDDDADDDDSDADDKKVPHSQTTRFKIQKFDEREQKWMKVESLGDKAVFLGYNTTFALLASHYPGCIPNSIYFTSGSGGGGEAEIIDGHDMGVFNLTDKSIKTLYPIGSQLTIPPPIWVTCLP